MLGLSHRRPFFCALGLDGTVGGQRRLFSRISDISLSNYSEETCTEGTQPPWCGIHALWRVRSNLLFERCWQTGGAIRKPNILLKVRKVFSVLRQFVIIQRGTEKGIPLVRMQQPFLRICSRKGFSFIFCLTSKTKHSKIQRIQPLVSFCGDG